MDYFVPQLPWETPSHLPIPRTFRSNREAMLFAPAAPLYAMYGNAPRIDVGSPAPVDPPPQAFPISGHRGRRHRRRRRH
jgi:hypothetical protein